MNINIIHLDFTPLILPHLGPFVTSFLLLDILQHSSRNIHPDGMTSEVWGCKQAVVSTYLKLWEKLENSVHWKNVPIKIFMLQSFIFAVHQNYDALWAVTAINLQIPQTHSKQLFLKIIIRVDICIAMVCFEGQRGKLAAFLQISA